MSQSEDWHDEMVASRRGLSRGAKEAMGEWIVPLAEWDLFGGLTFDQRRLQSWRVKLPPFKGGLLYESRPSRVVEYKLDCPRRLSCEGARVRFQSYVGRAESLLGRRIDYVVALEAHRNGWPHLHPLLALDGGLRQGDIAALGTLWFEMYGYGRLEVPRAAFDVAAYCAKYLSKDSAIGELVFSTRLQSTDRRPSKGAIEALYPNPTQLASLDGRVGSPPHPEQPAGRACEGRPYGKRGA